MQRLILTFLVNILFLNLYAQNKPELPPDFFDHFSYTLPANFNFNDDAQCRTEVNKIAAAMSLLLDSAENYFTLTDSTELYNQTDWRVAVNCQAGKFEQAIEGIKKCRELKPSPVYSSPFRLINLVYALACMNHPDDGSPAFTRIYRQSLLQQLNALDPVFVSDIVNQQKGYYSKSSVETFRKQLERVFTQAQNNTQNKLDFDAADYAVNAYQLYYQRKHFQPVIEETLFFISPARVKEEQVKIPMRDGIKLNAFYYRDELVREKLPAIVSLSPYPSGFEAARGNVFATNGYIYVYVDTRGRRESEGVFVPYEDDARDFYDIIDWVSKQSWCNGKVATSGGSYLGFTQWQAIRKEYKHPALKAINPMVAVGFGIDFPKYSGQFYSYMLQWATYVSGKELNQALFNDYKFWSAKNYELYKNRLPFQKLDSVAGMPNASFQKWLSHPDFDSYWKNILPTPDDYRNLDIPVFTITGYYDADQLGALYYYDNHQKYGNEKAKSNHYMLIGPFEHGAAQWQPGPVQNGEDLEKGAQIPIYKYVIWWFDWVLKGESKPAFIKDKITYFETGSNSWKGTSSFKNLTKDSIVLYLDTTTVKNKFRKDLRSLNLQMPANNQSLLYKHNIAMALDSSFLYAEAKPFDDSLYLTSPYNIVFESQPLTKDIVLSDKILARIFLSLNTPDADFGLVVDEIAPDGKSRLLCTDNIRVRYRNGADRPQLAKPREVMQLNFENAFVYIKKISKGSRLRITFQSINNPDSEKNFGFGGIVSHESTTSDRIIEATILMNKTYPSRIIIPTTGN